MILPVQRLRRGLGESDVNLFDGGIYGSGGFNFSGQPESWWEGLLDTGSQIALRRYGQPPAGTMITGPGGTIVRTSPDSNPAIGASLNLNAGGPGLNSVVLIGGLALVAILAMGARK